MEANKCPHCGAGESSSTEFTCGTRTYCNIRGEYCYEQEIDRLEERVAWLERWREVVIENAVVDWSEYDPKHWTVDIECSQSISVLTDGDSAAEAFDAAVRKEMEAKQ